MPRPRSLILIPTVVLSAALALAQPDISQSPVSSPASITQEHLQISFSAELNARAKYLAFAEQADSEGYRFIDGLFRAAALAESVHAGMMRIEMRKRGRDALLTPAMFGTKTTRENLMAALKMEMLERDQIYPAFTSQAISGGDSTAGSVFSQAGKAEAEHVKLFAAALEDSTLWRNSTRGLFVCMHCGYTVPSIKFVDCPSCRGPKADYAEID
jgi:rubrerythrin